MRKSLVAVLGLWLLAGTVVAAAASGSEPRIFILGVWPDRIRLFDEETETFVGEFRLRHGAALDSAHTPDYRRFFFVTDRMESVEVVDTVRRSVVDELKLSTPDRKVRFLGIASDPAGKILYLRARAVRLESDRFTPEVPEIIVYDLEAHRIKESFKLPEEIQDRIWLTLLRVSPDGNSLFVFDKDIYQLSTANYEIIDKIVLSKPLLAGYGPFRRFNLNETEPGLYYGIYRTTDPFLKKPMVGVVRFDLRSKEVENFELGPELRVDLFALSPDGTRGYAGLGDLIVLDMEAKRILKRKERFELGRTNDTLIVSADGKKLYVSGVGDMIHIFDAATLERMKSIFVGGDFMSPPFAFPRSVLEEGTHR